MGSRRRTPAAVRLALFVALACLALAACKPTNPRGILSKGEMEDILYDYHVAVAMGEIEQQGGSVDRGINLAYKAAILKKYGITEAEFDSSMVFYMRHTEQMRDVYKDLVERLNNKTLSLGGGVNGGALAGISAGGDTANVWRGKSALVLTTQRPFNAYSFEVKPDTSFHKGDKLMLDFNSQFIYQDGMRDAVAVLAVEFKNDSVASMHTRISNSLHSSVSIEDRDSLGIKRIRGYFLLNGGDFTSNMTSATTLKLLFIENIRLIRLHVPQPKVKPEDKPQPAKADSAAGAKQPGKPDTAAVKQPGRPLPPPRVQNR